MGVIPLAVVLALLAGCASNPKPRVAPPPLPAAQPAPARPARATPGPEARAVVASTDVVEAGRAYLTALYQADDATAALCQPGFGQHLRRDEDRYELEDLMARPLTWGEAGYVDADPSLEFVEVVARVRARNGTGAGSVYYKIGFKRDGDGVTIDLWSRRMDVRQAAG